MSTSRLRPVSPLGLGAVAGFTTLAAAGLAAVGHVGGRASLIAVGPVAAWLVVAIALCFPFALLIGRTRAVVGRVRAGPKTSRQPVAKPRR